jgi:6-pyruvoyltetrahydropterin/6-carboxytetrahydropterin synthase
MGAGLGAHYELVVTCRGEVDPTHGYLINIKEIDHAVRTHAIPLIQSALASPASHLPLPTAILLFQSLPLPGLQSVRWKLTPYYSLEVTAPTQSPTPSSSPSSDPAAPATAPTTVLLRQKFDFCAAHRLHSPKLSPEENRKLFGKCNNPSGHGHNYQFEPCIALTLSPGHNVTLSSFSLSDLERLADEIIVQRFDHKNLNTDTEEFRDGSGLNPSVENIAKVCYSLLAPAIASHGGAKLQSVTVWESDRTSCTYPA